MKAEHTPAPRPRISHTVCPQSGLHELWLFCGEKLLAGPAPLPAGWVALYNEARLGAVDADLGIAAAATGESHE